MVQFNSSKLLIDQWTFILRDGSVDISSVVRNLSAIFDVTMSMNSNIKRRPIQLLPGAADKVDPSRLAYNDGDSTRELCHHFTSDYCNGIVASVPKYHLDRRQYILNGAARLIFGYSRYEHITPLLRGRLNWLQVSQRSDFRRWLMVNAPISRHRLHLGLLCQCLDKPAAIESAFCMSQCSGSAASVGERSFGISWPTV